MDIDMTNNSGQTALHFALNHDLENIGVFLISKGADVNIKDKKGVSPLDVAVKRGKVNDDLNLK